MEAGDLNDWLNVVDVDTRLHMRCASFCMAQGDGSDVVRWPAHVLGASGGGGCWNGGSAIVYL